MYVLGIESSCDETGVAIYHATQGLVAHCLYSQIALHQQYGGVVPELASRDHVKYIVSLVDETLQQAGIDKNQLNAVAYTAGPGLIGALLTGACFAKSFAFALNIPAYAVHHLEAHLLAAQLESPAIQFPFLALLVSGGHTQLIKAVSLGEYQLLGDTIDDAAGEAFDKTAKLMGIPYPGGAMLAKNADNFDPSRDPHLPAFPRPMTDRPGLDFSFSGLKTHALMTWNKSEQNQAYKRSIAFNFQEAVMDTLFIKTKRALDKTDIKNLVVAGGVGANRRLREKLTELMHTVNGEVFFPSAEFCTDNGAMVAYAGYLHLAKGEQDTDLAVNVHARWPLAK